MIINTERDNAVTVLKLQGRLDTTTAPELEAAIGNEGEALKKLILDMKELDYISSAGLRVLLTAHKKMMKQGELKVINVTEPVMDVFEMTGFSDILEIE